MSARNEKDLKFFRKMGVPENDPRILGLKRRIEADNAAESRVTHTDGEQNAEPQR